jgi:hypothetical protein
MNSRPAQDAWFVQLSTESQGSVPNTLAAAAALVVIGGVVYRGSAEEADARRRWQATNTGR